MTVTLRCALPRGYCTELLIVGCTEDSVGLFVGSRSAEIVGTFFQELVTLAGWTFAGGSLVPVTMMQAGQRGFT